MAIKIGSGGDSVKNIYVWINVPDYTVQRKNRNGTVLETDYNVMEGTTPTYDSATPTRSGYSFTGWSPTPAPIYADTDYTAQFELPYLCFTAVDANCNVVISKIGNPTTVTLETSTDGTTRNTYTFGTQIALTNIGDKVYRRNTSTTTTGFSLGTTNYYTVSSSGGKKFAASGDICYLLNKNSTTTVSDYCFTYLFYSCSGLTTPPKLPATTLGAFCYRNMFMQCPNLTSLPKLPATTLGNYCYYQMFYGCTNIKLSTTQTGTYQTAYRIPTSGTGTSGNNSLYQMFTSTGGTFTGTPSINTTYYTSNTVV